MPEPSIKQQVLITLTTPPSLEEGMVDWLLNFSENVGFTSNKAHGHSSGIDGLNLAEQVAGRKEQVRFQLHIPANDLSTFLETLRKDFAGAEVHYWVAPLLEVGHV